MNAKLIDTRALEKNLDFFAKKGKIIAMIKANAYGHGIQNIIPQIEDKVSFFGVANLDEALEAKNLTDTPILIVSPYVDIEKCVKNDISFFAEDLSIISRSIKQKFSHLVHIKINCGMERFGIRYDDYSTLEKLKKIAKNTLFGGICTHFSETENDKIYSEELSRFYKVRDYLNICAPSHIGGSGCAFYEFDCNMIRTGIGLYGYPSGEHVMKITSNIIKINKIKQGQPVGYNGKFLAKRDSLIAIIPIGYADGLSRKSTGFYVKIKKNYCKIVGNICMDCCFIDVTDIKCKVGDKVIVMDDAERMSNHIGSIPYEVLTGFNKLRE